MTLDRFKYISFRLMKGLAILSGSFLFLLILGGLISLCGLYPWLNLIWVTPVITALAWGLGGNLE